MSGVLDGSTRRPWIDRLEAQGIEVGWDEKTDTPFSLRGKGLGTRALGGRSGRNVFAGTYADRALAVMENLAPAFGIRSAAQELKASGPEQLDDLGFRHQRLDQQYQGIPVVGGDLKVHFDAEGIPYEVSGRFVPGIQLGTKPQISALESEASAKEAFSAEARSLAGLRVHETAALVVLAVEQAPVLAYQVGVSSTPDQAYRFWVDARSGEVIRKVSQVCGIQAPSNRGTSVQLRGMRLPAEGGAYVIFPGWRENGVYYMNDPSSYTYVFNCNNTTSTVNNVANITNDFGTYAFRPTLNWSNSDPAAVSVAANMVTILSYYKNVHNRRSADGQGTVVPAYVHYDQDLGNAYFSFREKAMFYGDGDEYSNAWGVLDMAAHELTHGVTYFTANLEYLNESGALNESFSDIFGINIEFFGQTDMQNLYPQKLPGTADWLLGEDLVLLGSTLRDMRSPGNTSTLNAIRDGLLQPSRYGGSNWWDYRKDPGDFGGVHFNSGVQNHFYYLLCQGGKGKNDGLNYNFTGIGINNARLIAYRALTVYCTQFTTFAGARTAWLSAAKDLNPAWVAPVAAAWDAVGVSGASSPPSGGSTQSSFASAETLSGRFFNATVGGSKITSNGRTFWWRWTAPSTGRLQLDTSRSSSGSDTVLSVFSVSNNLLQSPAKFSNDNQSASVRWSQLDFGVIQGESYAFSVSGMKTGQNLILSGALAIQNGPANDSIFAATEKSGSRWTERGSNHNATADLRKGISVGNYTNVSVAEPAHAKAAASQSVWFIWTAPEDRTVTLSTAGSATDTVLAVYVVFIRSNSPLIYNQVAANDDVSSNDITSQVRFGAKKGDSYYIVVDTKNNQPGPYVLELR